MSIFYTETDGGEYYPPQFNLDNLIGYTDGAPFSNVTSNPIEDKIKE